MKLWNSSILFQLPLAVGLCGTAYSAAPTSGKLYHIVAKHSGKCLDVTDHSVRADTQLQQWDCSGSLNQTFRINSAGKDLYTLTAEESVMRLKVAEGLTANGSPLIQSTDFEGSGSQVKFVLMPDGSYQIRLADSGKCLEVADVSLQNEAKVQQWDCSGASHQTWVLRDALELPISVPEGFVLEKLGANLDGPRFMAFSKDGDLVIGSGSGKIYRLTAPYNEATVISDFRANAHSVAFRQTDKGEELWVGETGGLYKVLYESGTKYEKSDYQKVVSLPSGGGHATRTVAVGPDNKIYVSLGISGNCSVQFLGESFPVNDRRGGILQLAEDGDKVELIPYGTGLRNPVGYAWHPTTNVMYANNNGPDHWGFDEPREVFVEVTPGAFFGMPFYQVVGGQVKQDSCAPAEKAPYALADVQLPVATFPARSAPLGMTFVSEGQLDPAWAGSSLVAIHGSWAVPANGDEAGKRAPSLQLVKFVDGKATGEVVEILGGFQYANGDRFARPAGVVMGPDNYLYMTSDQENKGLYRLRPIK